MKTGILAIVLGLFLFSHMTEAKIREIPLPRCQQLAHDYAENPDSLEGERLRQLQFCINQTLAKRQSLQPPKMLQGTIIEPLTSPGNDSLPTPLKQGN